MPKRDASRRSKPEYQIKTARERINGLVQRAVKISSVRPELAKRYFELAKKIGMRYNVPIPGSYKRKFCKKCFSYLGEGWRFKKGVAHNICKNCGTSARYPYKPKKIKVR